MKRRYRVGEAPMARPTKNNDVTFTGKEKDAGEELKIVVFFRERDKLARFGSSV